MLRLWVDCALRVLRLRPSCGLTEAQKDAAFRAFVDEVTDEELEKWRKFLGHKVESGG